VTDKRATTEKLCVALIGSFRQHYNEVLRVASVFTQHGWSISSPKCSSLVSGGLFVRFETDDRQLSDAEIQSLTLKNIFAADLAYVVNPNGYIGRTTCYEIGRIIQRRQPIYFLSQPEDLPVEIPMWAVISPPDLLRSLGLSPKPRWLFDGTTSNVATIERQL